MVFQNANEAFEWFYTTILLQPDRKNGTRSLFNQSFTILNPLDNLITTPFRKWKKSYADLEFEWYKTGNRDPEMVESVAKIWTAMKDENGFVNSNYGYWWLKNHQLNRLINILNEDNESRRAVIVHYDPNDSHNYSKDTPCNMVLNFRIEGERLHLTVFARSIDLVYGFCNDQYCFSLLFNFVMQELTLLPGTIHYFITDLHIYKKHFNLKPL